MLPDVQGHDQDHAANEPYAGVITKVGAVQGAWRELITGGLWTKYCRDTGCAAPALPAGTGQALIREVTLGRGHAWEQGLIFWSL